MNVWDYWTHIEPDLIVDRSNGDDACKSFYNYPQDIGMIKNLGVRSICLTLTKFSIKFCHSYVIHNRLDLIG